VKSTNFSSEKQARLVSWGSQPDRDIAIEYIGRRPGEKIFERLWQEEEVPRPTQFEKILVAQTNGHDPWELVGRLQEIEKLAESMQRQAMYEKIQELIPTYRPADFGLPISDCGGEVGG